MEVISTRNELIEVTMRLVREHEGVLPAGSVIRCVSTCRDELARAGVDQGLTHAVEALASRRLADRVAEQAGAVRVFQVG